MGLGVLGGLPKERYLIRKFSSPVWMIDMKYKIICLGCLAVITLVLSSCSGEVNGVPEPYHASSATLAGEGALSTPEQQRTPVLTPEGQ